MSRVLFFLLLCQSVFADILFIDVNDSESEVREARLEARARGENLVVIPKATNSAPLADQLRETLNDSLFDHAFSDQKFSTVIVSGHYANSRFYGENHGRNQELTYSEISSIFREPRFAPVRESVETLMLWGCYTARPRAIADWNNLFPNVEMLAGFNFAAPSSNTIASPRIMRNLLRASRNNISDNRLRRSIQTLVNMTDGSEDPYDVFNMTNIAIVAGSCYMSSRLGNMRENRLVECPPSLIQQLINRRRRSFDPFDNGSPTNQELSSRARSSGENGLYRFKIDSIQYGRCFERTSQLPDPEEVRALCYRYNCD